MIPSLGPLSSRSMTGVALATPVSVDGRIDHARLLNHARAMLTRGVDVLTLFGTTGEGCSFDHKERLKAIDACIDADIDAEVLGVGVFDNASHAAAEHCRELFMRGCSFVLLAPPSYFNYPDDEGLYRWFAEIFDAVVQPSRFVLYHIPSVTAVPLSLPLIDRLHRAFPDHVIGVKDSSGNWSYTERLLDRSDELVVLVGHEPHLVSAVQGGGRGAISGIANLLPELIKAMIVNAEPDERVDALAAELVRFPVVPAIKALLCHQLKDEEWLNCKAPLAELHQDALRHLAVHLDLLFSD